MKYKKYPNRTLRHIISAPFIYWMIIPSILFDISLELYHRIAFTMYKLPLIKRHKYIKIDRHKIAYLNLFEKVHCIYCGYINGLLHYASVIAGETEEYWCGIMHKKENEFIAPKHHKNLMQYNDKKGYNKLSK